MANILLVLFVLLPLLFGIPILVGVYVYRDANKRGMNAVLWLLIAILTPSLLGLIIYLLVRNNYSDLTCPNCNAQVEETYVVCPNCRTKLRPTCNVCSAPVQPAWKVCPHCGTELPEYSGDVATPVRQKDKTLSKILIAILIIPIALILLIIIAALSFGAVRQSGGYATSIVTMTMDEFLESQSEKEQELFTDWFETCSSPVNDQSYHIYEYEGDVSNGSYQYQYLIYIPGAHGYQDEYMEISYDMETRGFFRKQDYWTLDIVCDEQGDEQQIFILEYTGTSQPPESFLITYNGNEQETRSYYTSGTPFYGSSFGPNAE